MFTEAEVAYDAGAALWRTPDHELPEGVVDDIVGACPFPKGDPQRAAWLKGYRDAENKVRKTRASITEAIDDEIEVESNVA